MNAPSARIKIFTFKDGVLSRLGHDLLLECRPTNVTLDGDRVVATIDPRTIRVCGAMLDGRLDERTLKADDVQQIQNNLYDTVLETRRYSQIVFEGRVDASTLKVTGELTLHGQRRPLAMTGEQRGSLVVVRTSLSPSTFGIKPFKALLGALRLRDHVELEIEVDASARENTP